MFCFLGLFFFLNSKTERVPQLSQVGDASMMCAVRTLTHVLTISNGMLDFDKLSGPLSLDKCETDSAPQCVRVCLCVTAGLTFSLALENVYDLTKVLPAQPDSLTSVTLYIARLCCPRWQTRRTDLSVKYLFVKTPSNSGFLQYHTLPKG